MSDVEKAEKALADWDAAHQLESIDPGMQSMRFHQTERQRTKELGTFLNRMRRESEERARLVEAVAKAKREARRAAVPTEPVDPALLKGATHILVNEGYWASWMKVKRVNAKTVTCCADPGMDEPRIPHDRIVGVHTVKETGNA